MWDRELATDPDRTFLLDGVENGFQLLPKGASLSHAEQANYFSATAPDNRAKVEETILEEIKSGNYVISSVKPTIISAIGAIPKPDSTEIRIIHDCSMPKGRGVNSYISVDKYKYQTIDDAVKLIRPGSWLAKIDIRHAYRHVGIHLANFLATGLKWHFAGDSSPTYMFDTRLPFGARSAPGIFHRLSQAIRRMMSRRGFSVIAYLDDFLIISSSEDECLRGYHLLFNLLLELGFTLSSHKAVPPCQDLVFLGIRFDTVRLTLSLPRDKLSDLHIMIKSFLQKKTVSKRELQRLIGKLNWACRVVYGGRTFLRRAIDFMNTLNRPRSKSLMSKSLLLDLRWWDSFLSTFNGQCSFFDSRPITDLQTDACPVGAGAYWHGDWSYWNFFTDLPHLSQLHINFKECLCIVLAALRWGSQWQNRHIIVYCDNQAAVAMINKGSTGNPIMMSYLRLLFWLSASHNFRITAKYLPGKENTIADCISRLHEPPMMLRWARWLSQTGEGWNINLLQYISYSTYLGLIQHFTHLSSYCFSFRFPGIGVGS